MSHRRSLGVGLRPYTAAMTAREFDPFSLDVKAFAKAAGALSATFSPEIRRLAESYLQDPVLVEVARPNATASNVEQRFYSVATDDKRRAVM